MRCSLKQYLNWIKLGIPLQFFIHMKTNEMLKRFVLASRMLSKLEARNEYNLLIENYYLSVQCTCTAHMPGLWRIKLIFCFESQRKMLIGGLHLCYMHLHYVVMLSVCLVSNIFLVSHIVFVHRWCFGWRRGVKHCIRQKLL